MKKQFLRIGIIVPQFPTLTETFFSNLVSGLCDKGHEVIVFSHERKVNTRLIQAFGLDQYPRLIITHFHFSIFQWATIKVLLGRPGIIFHNFSLNFKNMRSLVYRKLCQIKLNQHACDVYHYGYSGIAIAQLDTFEKIKGKKMVSCRGTAENVLSITEPGRPEKLHELFEKTDSIHCVSGALALKIKRFGALPEKIFINRPAINIHFFKKEKSKRKVNPTVKILSVGRMVFQKGYMLGLLAMAVLREQFENFTWVIAGDGPGKEELLFTINKLKLNDRVQLVGRKNLPEIKKLYDEADIFFLPSVCEGIANVVLEAMAMELAVVSSDCGGMEEVITNDHDGLLCENYNYHKYAAALLELCLHQEKRWRLGWQARKRIESEFSLERFIDAYELAYRQLIDAAISKNEVIAV